MKSIVNDAGLGWSLFRLSDRKQFDQVSFANIAFLYRVLPKKAHAEWMIWQEGMSEWQPFSDLSQILESSSDKTRPAPPPIPTGEGSLTSSAEARLKQASEKFGSTADGSQTSSIDDLSQGARSSVSYRAIEAAASNLRLRSGMTQNSFNSPAIEPMKSPTENGRVLTFPDEATLSLALESEAASEDRDHVRYNKKFKVRIFTPTGVLQVVTLDCSTSGFRLKEPLPSGLPRFFHAEIDLGPEGKIPLVCSEIREKDGRSSTRVRIQVNDHANLLKAALVRVA
ncbi:MAG: hypothetical protein RBT63_05780 [Bdellovibrionales bacterium]|jgi:hypothetical protein|nr:hypothetical protein [Bdellovibrionales bacterium]